MKNQASASTALVTTLQPLTVAKVQHIRGVGRFRNCSPQGDVAFRKFNLIFGENARGKTTLCAILRSLQMRQPAFINGRRSLGAPIAPQVVIGLTFGQAIFQNGSWSPLASDVQLRIFDAHYVTDNIYSGDAIGSDQRRNLCRVILGRQGVALANRYDTIDKEIGEHAAAIRAARGIITSHAGTLTPEQFPALEPDTEIDPKIEAKATEVEGLKEIDRLRGREGLTVLHVSPLPSQMEHMLGRTLEDVSRDAERVVRAHIASHGMATHGEEWITEGLSYVASETCPFCGQSVHGLDLLAAYQTFFNESYRQLQGELTRYRVNAARLLADEKAELLRSHLAGNLTSIDLWARYLPITRPEPVDPGQLTSKMTAFRDAMLAALDRKLASPLDAIELPANYTVARDRYAAIVRTVATYNQQVITANEAIETFKAKANPTRTHEAERELAALRIKKRRFEPAVEDACERFRAASAAKAKAEGGKQKIRDQLDAYSEAVLLRYKTRINTYLKRFTAGFHIDRVKVEYSGRVPNSTFCIVINDTHVEVGGPDAPIDEPCFRNTLSAGDRSTLALAFFLAELMEDSDRSHCIVLFDDPFSSQDQFRRTCTIGEIQRCGDHVAQVVVMSHDRHFLKAIWDLPLPSADRKALWLLPSGKSDTVIGDWDIEGDTESEDAADRRVLLEYYHQPGEGDPRDVIKKLRPVAETHMRRLAPDQLANVKGLGNMIQRIRTDRKPLSLMDCLHDLTDINSYTRRYMHGENANAASESVSRGELQGFVGKLLEIAGAMPG